MAWLAEVAAPILERLGAGAVTSGAEAGAGDAAAESAATAGGGTVREANDSIGSKILGSAAKYAGVHELVKGVEGAGHAAGSTIGTGADPMEKVNIGSVGNI